VDLGAETSVSLAGTFAEEALYDVVLTEAEGLAAVFRDWSIAAVDWSAIRVSSFTIITLSTSAGCVVTPDDGDGACTSADFVEDLPAFAALAFWDLEITAAKFLKKLYNNRTKME